MKDTASKLDALLPANGDTSGSSLVPDVLIRAAVVELWFWRRFEVVAAMIANAAIPVGVVAILIWAVATLVRG